MNHVSIFEKRWLELVFEGRNKNYGAYRLRLENPRTTVFALFLALLLMATAVAVPVALHKLFFQPLPSVSVEDPVVTPLVLSDIKPPKPDGPAPAAIPVKPIDQVKKGTPLKNPVVTKSPEADQNIAPANTPQPQPETGTGAVTGTNPASGDGGNNTNAAGSGTGGAVDPGTIFIASTLTKLPMYPGGMQDFYREVARNFRQPDTEDSGNITVIVAFVIEKDGSLSDIRVARDPGHGMGAEAVRVLKSMKTKWEPGYIKNEPVRTAFTLPITLKVN